MKQLVPVLLLVFWAVGCGCRDQPARPAGERPSDAPATDSGQARSGDVPESPDDGVEENHKGRADREDGSGVRTYHTDDCEVWPSYDLPLVIEIELPEVPPEIMEPSAEIPDD